MPDVLKVMIVDDSALIRSFIERVLKTDAGIRIVGFSANGEEAVKNIGICRPDAIVLDIEMPVMDGITAIPHLLKQKPDVKIIMCSTLSRTGAEVSLKALSLGATDYVLKPSTSDGADQRDVFQRNLLASVNGLRKPSIKTETASQPSLRKVATSQTPQLLAIGSSTGGPNALTELFKHLKKCPVPIVVTQHMPKTFTAVLAKRLHESSGFACCEGQTGMVLEAGHIYIAPGDFHMILKRHDGNTVIELDQGPMENFCRPSVDPMLRSAVDIYGGRVLTPILTGMGVDGLAGARQVSHAGGTIIAQDEASSVVWGMPGAVTQAGLCSVVQPVPQLATTIQNILHIPLSDR